MLKYILYLIVIFIVGGLISGGIHLYRVAQKNKKEMAQYQGDEAIAVKPLGKVLVVYYSLSGHTRDIAEIIRNKTGADIYEIKTAEPIKQNPLMYLKIRKQLKEQKYPQLAGPLPDFSAYDMVFVGAPVWWYTIATPGLSFLQQADFQGKKVVPFSTQGSNYGSFFEDFTQRAKNAKLLTSADFNNLPAEYDQAVENKISRWLNSL